MNATNIISVNPSKATLGSLHPEITARIAASSRRSSLAAGRASALTAKALFGSTGSAEGVLTIARILFGIFLMASGGISLAAGISTEGIATAVAGLLLTAGLLTRISMFVAMALFAIESIAAIATASFPEAALLSFMASLIFAITGAGRYSADALLLRAIRRHIRRRALRRRTLQAQHSLSYRAYSSRL